jgi:hypothetical protein
MGYTKTNIADLAGVSVPLLRYYLAKFERDGYILNGGNASDGGRAVYDHDDALTVLSMLAAAFRRQGKDRQARAVERARSLVWDEAVGSATPSVTVAPVA